MNRLCALLVVDLLCSAVFATEPMPDNWTATSTGTNLPLRCHGAAVDCNDDNPCTDDACDAATGRCVFVNDDTNTCSDGNFCTQVDVCQAGVCFGSNPMACDGGCPPGFTPVQGLCQWSYDIAVGDLDNQAAFCDGTGQNRYNDCTGQPYGFHWTDLGAGLAAVTRIDVRLESGISCDSTTSGVTLNGSAVGSFSPSGDCSCTPARVTVSLPNLGLAAYAKGGLNAIAISPSVNCEGLSQSANLFARVTVTYLPYSSACSVGTCVPATGCSYSADPDGAACTDNNVCTADDLCGGGGCVPGAPIVCVDGNGCTDDSCDPVVGCVYANNTNACDDGNACTYGDACVGGSCVGAMVAVPSGTSGVSVIKTSAHITIAWTPAAGATTSDVLRGDLASLPVGPGGGDEVCLVSTSATTITDTDVAAVGSGVWYLVRGSNCAGDEPYGFEGVHGLPGAPRVSSTCP